MALAFVSGWMLIRGTRRRANYDRGFALSDHADWPALNAAIEGSEAEEVWVAHGYRDELARWLWERGRHAVGVETRFVGEALTAELEALDPRRGLKRLRTPERCPELVSGVACVARLSPVVQPR